MSLPDATPQTNYVKYVPKEGTMKRIGKFHVKLYKLTGGLLGKRVDGLDILLLSTIGKKTGEKRTVPLPFYRDGERFLLVASFGGNDKNPAWFNNLAANPNVELQVGFQKMKAVAKVAEPAEREKLWADVTRAFPRYLAYQEKTERKIPIVVLEPTGGTWYW
jgi:F420H(2)-dependent quinone reductase